MEKVSDYFGSMVFDDRVMKSVLSAKVYASLKKTIDEGAALDISVANAVALAMKDWAISKGAAVPRLLTVSSPPVTVSPRRKRC